MAPEFDVETIFPKPQSVVALMSKYSGKPSEIGKLSKPTIATIKSNATKKRKFFKRGTVKIDQTYVEARRGKETRKTYKHHVLEPLAETITASTREEAIKLYKELANTKLNSEAIIKKNMSQPSISVR